MATFKDLRHAWNTFLNVPPPSAADALQTFSNPQSLNRPDRIRFGASNAKSIVSSLYTRLAIDVSGTKVRHVRKDVNDRYTGEMVSALNNCLSVEPNMDQSPSHFLRDIAITLFDTGVAAIVPVDTTLDPSVSTSYDIKSMRVGVIKQWYPQKVKVILYNDQTGRNEIVVLPKAQVAIVENPLYAIMNEPNSTLQRLITKLNLLDYVDDQSASGKLDLIVQLPYVVKTELKRQQAEQRRQDLEFQLKDSKYGIGYLDATEKITQLNRPAENNLLAQIESLTNLLYSQLGIDETVLNGTANEQTMTNYMTRSIQPIVDAVVEAMHRTFLTNTARTQGQAIMSFKDVFKFVSLTSFAQAADIFTRDQILSSNELRGVIQYAPSIDPSADSLQNPNMPPVPGAVGTPGMAAPALPTDTTTPAAAVATQPADTTNEDDAMTKVVNDAFDKASKNVQDLLDMLGPEEDNAGS